MPPLPRRIPYTHTRHTPVRYSSQDASTWSRRSQPKSLQLQSSPSLSTIPICCSQPRTPQSRQQGKTSFQTEASPSDSPYRGPYDCMSCCPTALRGTDCPYAIRCRRRWGIHPKSRLSRRMMKSLPRLGILWSCDWYRQNSAPPGTTHYGSCDTSWFAHGTSPLRGCRESQSHQIHSSRMGGWLDHRHKVQAHFRNSCEIGQGC